MEKIEQLLNLTGAVAAFEASGGGELLNHRIADSRRLTPEVLELLAHMCAANVSIAKMQARGWEMMTELGGFHPVRQFTLVGFDWTVSVGLHGDRLLGVVLRNDTLDLEAAATALGSE